MIEIIITPSKKSDKKFDATIDGKKPYHLEQRGTQILPNTKIQQENNGIWIAIRLEKTGMILQQLGR